MTYDPYKDRIAQKITFALYHNEKYLNSEFTKGNKVPKKKTH